MNYKYLIAILFACLLIIPFSFASDNQTLLDDGAVSSNENSYYFDASCENDNGNGSLENPYKYLKSDRIRDNSNIYLKDGEYLLINLQTLIMLVFMVQTVRIHQSYILVMLLLFQRI